MLDAVDAAMLSGGQCDSDCALVDSDDELEDEPARPGPAATDAERDGVVFDSARLRRCSQQPTREARARARRAG